MNNLINAAYMQKVMRVVAPIVNISTDITVEVAMQNFESAGPCRSVNVNILGRSNELLKENKSVFIKQFSFNDYCYDFAKYNRKTMKELKAFVARMSENYAGVLNEAVAQENQLYNN